MVHMLSKVIYVLEYIEPMYRGPSRGPCIGTIYPTLLGFGGIQATILSYPLLYMVSEPRSWVRSLPATQFPLRDFPCVSRVLRPAAGYAAH